VHTRCIILINLKNTEYKNKFASRATGDFSDLFYLVGIESKLSIRLICRFCFPTSYSCTFASNLHSDLAFFLPFCKEGQEKACDDINKYVSFSVRV
jgi:hypothetical protein